jgi:putative ABC transport system permease protein
LSKIGGSTTIAGIRLRKKMINLLRFLRKPQAGKTPRFFGEVLLQNIRYAIRGFCAKPMFTLTIVATLMLGIGATTAVFSVVDRILFRPLPYAHADRLVSLGLVQSLEKQEFMVGGFYFNWRDRQQPFVAMAAEQAVAHECDLTDRNPAQLNCSAIEAGLLPMLGVSPVLGRNFLPEEDRPHGPRVALLSYALWRTRYNRDPGLLGRIIEIDGDRLQVVGVLPQDFELPSLHAADVLLPLAMDEGVQRTLSPGQPLRGFARLKPGVSIEQARLQMEPLFDSIARIIPAEIRKDFHVKIRSLRDRQMDDVRPLALVLLGTVVAVLLIACANVASLLLARGAARTRELAVRSALGASRGRLAGQAMTEAMLLALVGAAAGCGFAELLLQLLLTMAPPNIPYLNLIRIDYRIFGGAVALALLCGLVFGLAPAWEKANGDMLSARFSRPVSKARLRQSLVIIQIAASMVLLAAAGLLARSFWNLETQQLGMRTQNTVTAAITLGERNYGSNQKTFAFFQQLATRLRYGPDVSLVAIADSLPPAANHNERRFSSIGVGGKPPVAGDAGGVVSFRRVSPDYFKALDIPLLRGEGFTDQQRSSSDRFVVLSQTLADRLFPGENPLGQRLQFDRATSGQVGDVVHKSSPAIDSYLVTGVAADVKNAGLTGEDVPEYYLLRRDRAEDWDRSGAWGSSAVVILRTSRPAATVFPWIRGQVAAMDPTLPVDIASMQQRVSKLADTPRFQTSLVSCFAAMGLVLAVIGIYGVISFLVTQRTQEIGVRMALGASRGNILRLVLGTSFRLIAWGTVLGLIAALAASRVLASLLFGVSAHDPITFLLVALLLVGVALLATLLPARFATRVDPIVALRYE